MQQNTIINSFIKQAIDQSLSQVYHYGRRSPHRVKHIHYWIRNYIQNRLGDNYKCYSYNPLSIKDDKEIKVAGRFYPKNSDITICTTQYNSEKILGVISVKFILSNYKQNSNNYFESMIGECYNMKTNNIRYGHVLICPLHIPYYDIQTHLKRIEKLNSWDIKKYVELSDTDIAYKPDMLSFNILDIKTDDGIIPNPDLFKYLSLKEQNDMLYKIKDKCELLQDKKINQLFNLNTSNYLKNNSIIKSLDKYMDSIEEDLCVYKRVHNATITDRRNINKRKSSDNRNESFFKKIIKKFKK